jgi:large repetitive protein
VTKVEPNSGPKAGGTSVSITGTGFVLTGAEVLFGSTAASSKTVNSETLITAVSPPGEGTVDVRVKTAGGLSLIVEGDKFTYK